MNTHKTTAYNQTSNHSKPAKNAGNIKKLDFAIEAGREYVALCDLLQLVDLVGSGGAGKHMVAEGGVYVNGSKELRKTCKIRAGQVVSGDGFSIKVTQG